LKANESIDNKDLYELSRMLQAEGFHEVPSWVVTQARERLAYVQETVAFLADTFLLAPITWLVSTHAPGILL